MRQISKLAVFALGFLPAVAAAQVPQTLPPNTLVGRLGVTPGPAQAIPFATAAKILNGALIITINGTVCNVGGVCTVPAAAGSLTGLSLASNVVNSSLTGAAGGQFGPLAYLSVGTIPSTFMSAYSGDCTSSAGTTVLNCTKTNGVAFTAAATTAIGTSGATIPLLNGNNTYSGTSTFSGAVTLPAQAAATFLANPTGSSAAPTPTTIGSLTANGSPNPTTTTVPCETGGSLGKCTVGSIAGSTSSGINQIGGSSGPNIAVASDLAVTGSTLGLTSTNGSGQVAKTTGPVFVNPSANQFSASLFNITDAAFPHTIYNLSSAPLDQKNWFIFNDASSFNLQAVNDAQSTSAEAFGISRSGTTITQTSLYGSVALTSVVNCGTALSTFNNGVIYCNAFAGGSPVSYAGIDCSGATASDAAVNAAVAASSTINFPIGCSITLASSNTWPAAKQYNFPCGSRLTTNANVVINIKGTVQADHACQIFDVSASNSAVTGIRSVRPEWWGAKRDGSTDDAVPITAAIASVVASTASDGSEFELKFSCGPYATGSQITVPMSNSVPWRIRGCGTVGGTTILTKPSFSGGIGLYLGSSSTQTVDFVLKDITVQNTTRATGPSIGLQIGTGSAGVMLQGTQNSLVENVHTGGFNVGIKSVNTRLISWRNNSAWPGDTAGNDAVGAYPLYISCVGTNCFTGDQDFWNLQTVAPSTPSGAGVVLDNNQTGGILSGIRFHALIGYYGTIGVQLSASGANSTISDFWIDSGSQLEAAAGQNATGVQAIASAGGSKIIDVHLSNMYLSGSGWRSPIVFGVANGGQFTDIILHHNFIANFGNGFSAIDMRGTGGGGQSIIVSDNDIRGPFGTTNAGIYIENVTRATANGNTAGSAGGSMPNIVQFNGGTGDYITAIGNNCGGLCTSTPVVNSGGVAHAQIGFNQ